MPGLRREELAVLAGLSPDYYSRVEQGRKPNVSVEVLDALARALRLDDTERAHLHTLASPPRRRSSRPATNQQPDPGLLRLMTTLDHVPALVLGRSSTILATNHLLRAVLGRRFEPGSSLMRYLFLDPEARERIVNWESFAQASAGALRRELELRPDDVRLRRLVAELRAADPDAARWWDDQGVRDYASVPKQIAHPVAGVVVRHRVGDDSEPLRPAPHRLHRPARLADRPSPPPPRHLDRGTSRRSRRTSRRDEDRGRTRPALDPWLTT